MIKLSDKILPFLNSLTKNELILYLLIMRYISEEEKIPVDHIQKLMKFSDERMGLVLKSLVEKQIIEISSENLTLKDLISEKTMGFIVKNQPNEKARLYYIYNTINKYINLKNLKESNSIYNASSSLLDKNQQGLTVNLKTRLKTLRRGVVKREGIELVNYFADALHKLHNIPRTRELRMKQLAVAKKIIMDYGLTLEEWKQAIDHFISQEFWIDKLNSLKQIENNLSQFMIKLNKTKTKSETKVRSIK